MGNYNIDITISWCLLASQEISVKSVHKGENEIDKATNGYNSLNAINAFKYSSSFSFNEERRTIRGNQVNHS